MILKRAVDVDDNRNTKRARAGPGLDTGYVPHPPAMPLGNLLLRQDTVNARNPGLGRMAYLPDEIVASIFSELEAADLLRCQTTSKAFFAFSATESLWKLAYTKRARGELSGWKGSWRRTYLHAFAKPPSEYGCGSFPSDKLEIRSVFSDVLYLPYLAASYDVNLIARAPSFANNIVRRSGQDMDASQLGQTPLIISNAMGNWAAMGQEHRWSLSSIAARYPGAKFRAEAVLTYMSDYEAYHNACSADESPLYIFDADFVEKTRSDGVDDGLGADFEVPKLFSADLFKVLGHQRPNYRWLIAGPERSGSTFHCDPNGTSAWNAVVTGRKLWILFPPDIVPPGIIVSDDQSEVEAPLSLAEWLMNYYQQAKSLYGPRAKDPKLRGKMLEGICETGEIFYVPSGWWHLVVNLEPSIAVTQNFVTPTNLGGVLHFLKHRPMQVSGFRVPQEGGPQAITNIKGQENDSEDDDETGGGLVFARFVEALNKHSPDICMAGLKDLARLECQAGKPGTKAAEEHNSSTSRQNGSLWDDLTGQGGVKEQLGSHFTFGFDIEETDG